MPTTARPSKCFDPTVLLFVAFVSLSNSGCCFGGASDSYAVVPPAEARAILPGTWTATYLGGTYAVISFQTDDSLTEFGADGMMAMIADPTMAAASGAAPIAGGPYRLGAPGDLTEMLNETTYGIRFRDRDHMRLYRSASDFLEMNRIAEESPNRTADVTPTSAPETPMSATDLMPAEDVEPESGESHVRCVRVVQDPNPPLNVRAAASSTSPILATLDNGTEVTAGSSSTRRWSFIEAPVRGWVWADSISEVCP